MRILYICIVSFFLSSVSYVKTYILMDIDSGRIIEGSNIHNRCLTASIAKTMTAYVVIMEGNLDDVVTIDKEAILEQGSSIYLVENEEITVKDLLYGLMLRSGNDAACALAKHIGGSKEGFAFLMNEYAKIIGMKNSTFENPSGLDDESKNYSTPYDMALLMSKAYKNSDFRTIIGTKVYKNNDKVFVNKHRLVKLGEPYTGGKTGYTEMAGRTLITTASKNDLNLVVVTFNNSDDWNTHKYLLEKGFNNYEKRTIIKKQKFRNEQSGIYLPYLDEDICCVTKENEEFKFEIVINNADYLGYLHVYSGENLVLIKELKAYNIIEMSVCDD